MPVAMLRRYAFPVFALLLAGFFAVSAAINSGRLSAVCVVFAEEDALVTRALPEASPWREQIDERRFAIAAICERHLAEHTLPKTPEDP